MSATATGQKAEQVAAQYLETHGYSIIGRNWKRHKMCEIDIIARKQNCIYFVEVKYRATNDAGSGLTYITHKKLKQMAFAAEQWALEYEWQDAMQLSAIEVGGADFTVGAFIENVA
jgi:putative endonuclease